MSTAAIKMCTTCAEPIPMAATKCFKCGSYQDWRQYVAFSTTNLALVTALISVLTVAAPALYGTLQPNNSRLAPSFLGFQGTSAVILVVNSGKRPGAVTGARISLEGYGGIFPVVTLEPDKNYGIVEPGTARAVVFESPPLTPDDEESYNALLEKTESNNKCTFIIELQDFQQNVATRERKMTCYSAVQFLAHKYPSWNEI